MRNTPTQKGFALVMVLAMLALAACSMLAIVRQSSRLALEANTAQDQLQRRWLAFSLQQSLQDRLGQLLDQAEIGAGTPHRSIQYLLSLPTAEVRLVIGDEEAKANANTLYRHLDWQQFAQAVSSLSGNPNLQPRLSEATLGASQPGRARFESLGQLFESFCPSTIFPQSGQALPLEDITCWGGGRLNFHRCSRAALDQVARGILDQHQQAQLLSLRSDVPGISLPEALRQLQLTDRQKAGAEDILSDRSGAFSLWIVMRQNDRTWYRLAIVSSGGDSGGGPKKIFNW